jgi:hypothetical protein
MQNIHHPAKVAQDQIPHSFELESNELIVIGKEIAKKTKDCFENVNDSNQSNSFYKTLAEQKLKQINITVVEKQGSPKEAIRAMPSAQTSALIAKINKHLIQSITSGDDRRSKISNLLNQLEASHKKNVIFANEALNLQTAHQCIDSFLTNDLSDQEKLLADPAHRQELSNAIKHADLNRVINVINNESGNTLFHFLCTSPSSAVRQLALECIDAGFPINKPNEKGTTGLILLAYNHNDPHLAQELLMRGADLNYITPAGHTAVKLAKLMKHAEVVLTFYSHMLNDSVNQNKVLDLIYNVNALKSEANHQSISEACDQFLHKMANTINESVFDPYPRTDHKNKLLMKFCAYHGNWEAILKVANEPWGRKLLADLLTEAKDRNFSEEGDRTFVKGLIESRLLFLLAISSGKPKFIDDLQNVPDIELLLKTLPTSIDQLQSETVNLAQILAEDPKERFVYCLMREDEIKEQIGKIYDDDPKLGSLFKVAFESDFNIIQQHREAIESYQRGEDLNTKCKFLEEYCIHFELWDLFSKVHKIKGEISGFNSVQTFEGRTFFNLFLDKVLLPEDKDWGGFYTSYSASCLLRALNSMEQSKDYPHTAHFEQLKTDLVPLLKDAVLLEVASNIEVYKKSQLIWARLQQMEEGDKMLVPTGYKGHKTSLVVEKTANNTYRLSIYNTGDGIAEHHPRQPEGSGYQTHLVIDKVPANSVLQKELWLNLIRASAEANDMETTYEIFEQLGAGGVQPPPSQHAEDYEAVQLSGTCSLQNLMAMMRHRIMSNFPGTYIEKDAIYKQFKIELQSSWLKEQKAEDLKGFAKWVPIITHKLATEKLITDLALDHNASKKAIVECQGMLRGGGNEGAADAIELDDHMSPMARYTALRKAATLLSTRWMMEQGVPANLPGNNCIIALALTKFDAHKILLSNFSALLDEAEKQGNFSEWLERINSMILASKFPEVAVDEFASRLQSLAEEEQDKEMILSCFVPSCKALPTQRAIVALLEKSLENSLGKQSGPIILLLHEALRRENLGHLIVSTKYSSVANELDVTTKLSLK